jgi:hypothetical protein
MVLASLQSSESKPHCPHRSTLTFLILPYWLGLSRLPGVVGQVTRAQTAGVAPAEQLRASGR